MDAYRYYKKHGIKTQVLPASLTSVDEIMKLKGVDHITISEGLLRQLIQGKADQWQEKSLFEEEVNGKEVGELMKWGDDEKGWRMAFTRSGNGEGERKLSQVSLLTMGVREGLKTEADCVWRTRPSISFVICRQIWRR